MSGKSIMKNQIIAALLLSSAMIAVPAFAGNANLGNDVENWAGPSVLAHVQVRDQLIAARMAGKNIIPNNDNYYPQLANNGQGKTRAQVRQELIDAQESGELARENLTYRGN
jgi:hypothetical protein